MSQRTPLIAGNWKMNPTTFDECRALLRALRQTIDGVAGVERVVCPPFVWLMPALRDLDGTDIAVGAQNVHWESKGAFTGEVSPSMLKGWFRYVIVGHSERRQYFGENDDVVNRKVKVVIEAGLRPILCVGETKAEREAGRTEEVLVHQVYAALRGVTVSDGLVIAYEPVWAIGTGEAATGQMANEAIALIREEVGNLCGQEAAGEVRILYGGSVTADNVAEFMGQPEVDGALVGGASLDAEVFAAIVQTTARIKGA